MIGQGRSPRHMYNAFDMKQNRCSHQNMGELRGNPIPEIEKGCFLHIQCLLQNDKNTCRSQVYIIRNKLHCCQVQELSMVTCGVSQISHDKKRYQVAVSMSYEGIWATGLYARLLFSINLLNTTQKCFYSVSEISIDITLQL